MKKIVLIICFILTAFICFAYSKPTKTEENLNVITGIIQVYGNEPFTYIGIVTKDNKQYAVKTDKETSNVLRDTQGKKIEIKGTINPENENTLNKLKDGFIILIEWKIVE